VWQAVRMRHTVAVYERRRERQIGIAAVVAGKLIVCAVYNVAVAICGASNVTNVALSIVLPTERERFQQNHNRRLFAATSPSANADGACAMVAGGRRQAELAKRQEVVEGGRVR